jgi:hypothetical protein
MATKEHCAVRAELNTQVKEIPEPCDFSLQVIVEVGEQVSKQCDVRNFGQ